MSEERTMEETMLYRPHRGSLESAMEGIAELDNTIAALVSHLRSTEPNIHHKTVEVGLYSDRPDDRIGWEKTFVVTAEYTDGWRGVVGFTDHGVSVA